MPAARSPVQILLVNDRSGEVAIARRVFGEAEARQRLHVVGSDAEALDFLRREGAFGKAPRPGLVLLHRSLPGIAGLGVLDAMAHDAALRPIPVLVFACPENDDAATLAAYDARARAVIATPADACTFEQALHTLSAFWLQTAQLPIS